MTSLGVPLETQESGPAPIDRLVAALQTAEGMHAVRAGSARFSRADRTPWLLFETRAGRGGLRPTLLAGLAAPPLDPEDGPGAARQLEALEPLIVALETALGVGIAPLGLGEPSDGPRALLEATTPDGRRLGTEVCVPEQLAAALPPAGAPTGARTFRLTLPSPAPEDVPASGDLLLLGPSVACEAASLLPGTSLPFPARLVLDPAAEGLAAPFGTGLASITMTTTLTPDDLETLRRGTPLVLGPGPAPEAFLDWQGTAFPGRLVPFGAVIALRFD